MASKQTPESAEDWKWKVEDAARTLRNAEDIKRDKKLHAAALKELTSQRDDISKVLKAASMGKALMKK